MSNITKALIVASVIASSASAAFAQAYYYGQVPAEQRHWYDRNAVGQNV